MLTGGGLALANELKGEMGKRIFLDMKFFDIGATVEAAVRGVASGSVIIAAGQCIVTTLTMPTGWWIIGHSPTVILDPQGARPFLFDVGDRVAFRRLAP